MYFPNPPTSSRTHPEPARPLVRGPAPNTASTCKALAIPDSAGKPRSLRDIVNRRAYLEDTALNGPESDRTTMSEILDDPVGRPVAA